MKSRPHGLPSPRPRRLAQRGHWRRRSPPAWRSRVPLQSRAAGRGRARRRGSRRRRRRPSCRSEVRAAKGAAPVLSPVRLLRRRLSRSGRPGSIPLRPARLQAPEASRRQRREADRPGLRPAEPRRPPLSLGSPTAGPGRARHPRFRTCPPQPAFPVRRCVPRGWRPPAAGARREGRPAKPARRDWRRTGRVRRRGVAAAWRSRCRPTSRQGPRRLRQARPRSIGPGRLTS